MSFMVEVWTPDGGDIASNRYVGPFRKVTRAQGVVDRVRALGEILDGRLIELEPDDSITWRELKRWSDNGGMV